MRKGIFYRLLNKKKRKKERKKMFKHTKCLRNQNRFWPLNSNRKSPQVTEQHRILKGNVCAAALLQVQLPRTPLPLQRGISALADSWELEVENVKLRPKNTQTYLSAHRCSVLQWFTTTLCQCPSDVKLPGLKSIPV